MAKFLAAACRRLWRDDGAATAIEYALVACGIAVAITVAVYGVRDVLISNYYNKLGSDVFK
jgi:Flp pilus assembly pilin Flp